MDDLSSGGDSKTEEEVERRLPREKEGKDHDRDREEGILTVFAASSHIFLPTTFVLCSVIL